MPTSPPRSELLCRDTLASLRSSLEHFAPALSIQETGLIRSLRPGIARVGGLAGIQSDELVAFPAGPTSSDALPLLGIAFNLDAEEVGVILLGEGRHLQAGDEVRRTGRVVEVPVGEPLLGRMITVLGSPLDGQGAPICRERRPVEREAPAILDRGPVQRPLQTGWKVIDALIPIGRGQRELIIGDRQTGKTSIAVDAILNQKGQGVICIYCAIGQRSADTAGVVATLREHGAMEYTTVVVAAGQDPPGLHYITPYGASAMAEYFMERGEDVLIVYDDLTHHARTYRELSLLLRRPPGREAYPGDIFYLHSRLLERSTQLSGELGGGSLTALPIIETQAQNISAYIPTNLISITDGQIYLSSDLYRKSLLPAVDVGRSVSRVGGKTQPEVLRSVSSDLRLSYAQFEETEIFTRFGTQLDEETKKVIGRGRRIRELLRQRLHRPLAVDRQAILLLALEMGLLDDVPVERIEPLEPRLLEAAEHDLPDLCRRLRDGAPPDGEEREALRSCLAAAIDRSR